MSMHPASLARRTISSASLQRLHLAVDWIDPDQGMVYLLQMPVRLRRFFALLIMSAYLSAAILVAMPIANAAVVEMGGGMMHRQDGTSHEMPCKSKRPACIIELGCVFMVSLPAPDLAASTSIAWSPVTYYSGSLDPLHGRTIRPALGPPISRA